MIKSVEIKNLRGIQEGKLDDLTPLTVLVGPNGSGKSTVLDAIHIGGSPRFNEALFQTVERRKTRASRWKWFFWRAASNAKIMLTTYGDKSRTVTLEVDPSTSSGRITVSTSYEGGTRKLGEIIPGGTGSSISGDTTPLEDVPDLSLVEFPGDVPLHDLYSEVVVQGRQEEVKLLLSEILPNLKSVEILTESGQPIVFTVYRDYAAPVDLAGEGITALLNLGLHLASRRDGVVLLEEPEIHQHPRAIGQSSRAIWAAVRRGIQVIITTHSLELIDSLLADTQNDEELDKFSVYRTHLQEGCLRVNHIPGPDVAFRRVEIGDDLR